jgi:hypothetical protein
MPKEHVNHDPPPSPQKGYCAVLVRFVNEHRQPVAGTFSWEKWFYHNKVRIRSVYRADESNWCYAPASKDLMVLRPPKDLELGCGRTLDVPEIGFLCVEEGFCCVDYPTRTCQPSGFSFTAEVLRGQLRDEDKYEPWEGLVIHARYLGGGSVFPVESETRTDCCGNGFVAAEVGLWRLSAECPPGYEFEGGREVYRHLCTGQVMPVRWCLKKVEISVRVMLQDERQQPLENCEVSFCGPHMPGEAPRPEIRIPTGAQGIAILNGISQGLNRIAVYNEHHMRLSCNPDSIEVPHEGKTVIVEAREPASPATLQVHFPTASNRNLTGTVDLVQLSRDGSELRAADAAHCFRRQRQDATGRCDSVRRGLSQGQGLQGPWQTLSLRGLP